jgi:aminotransferase
MDNLISNNVKSIQISGIRKFYNKLSEYPDAISLTLGQPDFNVPDAIKCAMIKAINENKTAYTSNSGIVELREEIVRLLEKYHISYSPSEICITVGGSEAILDVFTALINRGDSILIPTPAYPAYESCAGLVGGRAINYELNEDFSINLVSLKAAIRKYKPKLLLLSFPSNPTGAVLSMEQRDALHDIIKENDIYVISDEIYSSIVFEDDYYSVAQYSDIIDKIILISGFSKMFSMTGLRIGYVCAQEDIMKEIMKVHQYNVSCAPSISQHGALAGLKHSIQDVELMKCEFKKRRDFCIDRLNSMGIQVSKPKGAFYIFPSIMKYGVDSNTFCERLLSEAKVAVVPGSAFGNGGEGFVRISYSYSMNELSEGFNRLENWIINNFE